MKKIFTIMITMIMLLVVSAAVRASDPVCVNLYNGTSVPAGSHADVIIRLSSGVATSSAIKYSLTETDGRFSFQPFVSAGTFDFKVYFSNVTTVPENDQWGLPITLDADVSSSSDGKCYPIDPNGPHSYMKIEATNTSGSTGNLNGSLCGD